MPTWHNESVNNTFALNSPRIGQQFTNSYLPLGSFVLTILHIHELEQKTAGRVHVFDQLRGLLLFWMILGHAFYLTGRPAKFPLDSLRLGAATDSFVMLTGFVIAWIYAPRPASDVQRRFLIRRSLFVFAVAYISNLVFALARDFASGQASLSNLLKMATFQRTWTISVILVATSLTIAVCVVLLPCVKKWAAGKVLICVTFALVAIHSCRALELPPTTWIDGVMDRTVFTHSLIDLTVASAWAFGLGAWLSEHRSDPILWAAVILGSIACYLPCRWHLVPESICAIARSPSQFVVSLWVASLIGSWTPMIGSALSVPGRHSLLIFLLHRVVLQVAMLVAGRHLVGAAGAWILVVFTSCVCWLVAYSIEPLRNSSAYQQTMRCISKLLPTPAA